jgi:hypothetical protein
MNRPRTIFAGASLLLPTLAIAVSFLIWRAGLPDRIASHWSDLGAADDSLPTLGVFLFAIIASVLATIAGIVVLSLPGVQARIKRAAVFWIGTVQGIAAAVWFVPAWLTWQAGSAEGAVLGIWVVALIGCALYGVVPYAIFARPPLPGASMPATMVLSPTETGAWSRTITANVFIWATLVVAALAALVSIPIALSGRLTAGVVGLIVLLVAGVAVASFIRLRVTIDWRGLRVVSLLLRIPLKRIPLSQIRAVESTELRPSEWGGWGYRIMPGRSALVLRGGPGVVVTTINDKQFAITLDTPDVPAALLQGLARQEQPGNL